MGLDAVQNFEKSRTSRDTFRDFQVGIEDEDELEYNTWLGELCLDKAEALTGEGIKCSWCSLSPS